ncbi:hypothetical protein L7F22_001262 [Adiantum nelumboides]|nr:hypothetical protein [Adiantum nelumboides]
MRQHEGAEYVDLKTENIWDDVYAGREGELHSLHIAFLGSLLCSLGSCSKPLSEQVPPWMVPFLGSAATITSSSRSASVHISSQLSPYTDDAKAFRRLSACAPSLKRQEELSIEGFAGLIFPDCYALESKLLPLVDSVANIIVVVCAEVLAVEQSLVDEEEFKAMHAKLEAAKMPAPLHNPLSDDTKLKGALHASSISMERATWRRTTWSRRTSWQLMSLQQERVPSGRALDLSLPLYIT